MEMNVNSNQIQHDEELENLRQFLSSNNVPSSDLALKGNIFITYNDQNGSLIGSGGIESYGSSALLRSVAVRSDLRGKKLGDYIVKDLLSRAEKIQFKSVFLLTETAHDFFAKKGFAKDRELENDWTYPALVLGNVYAKRNE